MNQARDVLYTQNPLNAQINPNIIQQFLPDTNIGLPSRPNTSYAGLYAMGLPQSQPSEQQFQQQQQQCSFITDTTSTINTQSSANSSALPWVQSLDKRLQQIEKQLGSQNINWQNIDTTLQNQNVRMTHMEKQMSELNCIKQNVAKVETSVTNIDRDVRSVSRKMQEYVESINTFSDMCDDIMSNQKHTDSIINSLNEKVEYLESEQKLLKSNVSQSGSAITDLQCRSMRENLIFTGIEEPELEEGEYEDAEQSLREFLETEMSIEKTIPFHRVHRLGRYESEYDPRNP